MDIHVSWLSYWDVLGSSRLGDILVLGPKRDNDLSIVLDSDCCRSCILRKETSTDKMVGPKFMCFNNIDRSDFVHSGRLAFLRLALVAKFFLLKPKT